MNETIRTNIPMYANPETDIYDRVVINPIPAFVSGVEKPRISLNGDWSFSMFPKENFWEDAADLSEWKSAKVPGDLDAQGFPVYCQEDPEWYGGFYQGSTPVFPGR